MSFEFDSKTGILKYDHGKQGFSVKPIYMIRCKCGTPVKAYFSGAFLYDNHDMDYLGFGGYYTQSDFRLIKQAKYGWGFWMRKNCPECRCPNITGRNEIEALANFIKQRLSIKNTNINKKRVQDLLAQIKNDPALQRFFIFKKEELSERTDTALIIGENNKYEKLLDVLEELRITYSDEEYWTEGNRETSEHFELEAGILEAHGEDCTCNLCME